LTSTKFLTAKPIHWTKVNGYMHVCVKQLVI